MFHHFHGENHPSGQGSVSADELLEILRFIRREQNVLGAQEFHDAALANQLRDGDTCLTFDDSLLCQYEIAAPVLDEEGLTGFFFVYSSAFSDSPDLLEVYRYFRSTEYRDFNAFCADFMDTVHRLFGNYVDDALNGFEPDTYLVEYPFYSRNDRLFRYVRDRVLPGIHYRQAMVSLMHARGFDVTTALPKLFMRPQHLVDLHNRGHVIGMHSHSHPLDVTALSVDSQHNEYAANLAFLESVLGEPPRTMSHPMGRYGDTTLTVLSAMGISLGFRANLAIKSAPSLLEIPREDHANVVGRMRT